jgi:hypothetical protein
MADDVKMVVVDGVRYRPEDAPKQKAEVEAKAKTPANKARTASNKEG